MASRCQSRCAASRSRGRSVGCAFPESQTDHPRLAFTSFTLEPLLPLFKNQFWLVVLKTIRRHRPRPAVQASLRHVWAGTRPCLPNSGLIPPDKITSSGNPNAQNFASMRATSSVIGARASRRPTAAHPVHRYVASCHRSLPIVKHAHRRAVERKVSYRVCERRAAAIDEDLDHRTIDIHPDLHTRRIICQSKKTIRKEKLFPWLYNRWISSHSKLMAVLVFVRFLRPDSRPLVCARVASRPDERADAPACTCGRLARVHAQPCTNLASSSVARTTGSRGRRS